MCTGGGSGGTVVSRVLDNPNTGKVLGAELQRQGKMPGNSAATATPKFESPNSITPPNSGVTSNSLGIPTGGASSGGGSSTGLSIPTS